MINTMKNNLDVYDCRTVWMDVESFVDCYEKTYLDPAVQRLGGVEHDSGWTDDNAADWFGKFVDRRTGNRVFFADVESCLRWAKENNDERSRLAYQRMSDLGMEYMSLDGNNAHSTCYHVIKKGFAWKDHNSQDSVSFEELPHNAIDTHHSGLTQKDILYKRNMEVNILKKISYAETFNFFRDQNISTSLNAQEYRQSNGTVMSAYIRDFSDQSRIKEIYDGLGVVGPKRFDERYHQEQTAIVCAKIHYGYNHKIKQNSNGLDKFYNDVESLSSEVKRDLEYVFGALEKVVKALPPAPPKKKNSKKNATKKKITNFKRYQFFGLIDLMLICRDLGFGVKKPKDFFEWYLGVDATWYKAAQSIPTEEYKKRSYIYFTKQVVEPKRYNKVRLLLKEALLKSEKSLLKEGVISVVRTHADYYSHNQLKELWSLQGAKDRWGKDIEILELYLGGVCHGDHRVSHAAGGETTIENGELMRAADNLAKGVSTNPPHFPHQEAR